MLTKSRKLCFTRCKIIAKRMEITMNQPAILGGTPVRSTKISYGKQSIDEKDIDFNNEFMKKMAEPTVDFTRAKDICRKYLKKCLNYCDRPPKTDNNDYDYLSDCINKVREGNVWSEGDFKNVVEEINRQGNYSDGIFKNTEWLIKGEGRTELNIQNKNIDMNIEKDKEKTK